MKYTLLLALLCTLLQSAWSQYRILGFVYDAEEEPYGLVEIRLRGEGIKRDTLTDPTGRFEFLDLPRGVYKVVAITGYGLVEREINLRTSIEMYMQRPRNILTDEVVVSAVRAGTNDPVTFTNINNKEIARRNLGQDVPEILTYTPSVVATSDAGTGFGYTGLRVRGTDATRINVTINGVPLNDAESQSVYWVDLPDVLSSTESIQIQRGVGSSTFGAGAFGASLNLNTVSTMTDPHAKVSLSGGSFGTYRGNVTLGSGLLGNHWTLDARASLINSDGYIDRASADLKSGFLSAAYIGSSHSLRLNVLHGHERTYQAWNGVPVQYADDPILRTFNTAGAEKPGEPYEDEVDDYGQTHFQLLWNASILTQIQTYVTLHYTHGDGYYEQYKSPDGFDTNFRNFLSPYELHPYDAIRRRWLDNDFYGIIGGFHYFDPTEKYSLQIGGAIHKYKGNHFGEVIKSLGGSVDHLPKYYDNDAEKNDKSVFVKLNYHFAPTVSLTGDVQVRGVNYTYEGLDASGKPLEQSVALTFLNPKFGLSWQMHDHSRLYYFFGIAHHEPNRDDYITSTVFSRPDPEILFNSELGWAYKGTVLDVGINAFHMYYKDQLVLTGRINDVGEYARQNIDKSYRLGLEATASVHKDDWDANLTATWSRNRVTAYDEYIDDWQTGEQIILSHDDAPLAFSPDFIAGGEIGYHLINDERNTLRIGFATKYVGDQYLDNSGNDASVLEGYAFSDLQLTYGRVIKGGRVDFNVMLRNVFDAQYSSNGWIYRFVSPEYDPRPDDPYAGLEQGDTYHLLGLFPQAGRNILAGVTVSF